MHKRMGTSQTWLFSAFPADLSVRALSKRLPHTTRNISALWEPGEGWGLLSYAASAFCSAMMIVTVKLGIKEGLSAWELLLARSLFLAAVCVVQLRRSNDSMLGQRCGLSCTQACLQAFNMSGTGQGRQHWPGTVSKCLKLTPHCRRDLLSLRGFLGCCSVTALFFATKKLPVADATVFSFLAPVMVAVLSPIFLQESSKGAWVAIAGCSFGVLLVAQPGFLFGSTRLSVFGVCMGILHSTASGTAKVLCFPLRRIELHVALSVPSMRACVFFRTDYPTPPRAADVCQSAEGGGHACEDAVPGHVQYPPIGNRHALHQPQGTDMAQLHDAFRMWCAFACVLRLTTCHGHTCTYTVSRRTVKMRV